jgi:hypothetical protein
MNQNPVLVHGNNPVACNEEVVASTAHGVNSFSDSLGDQTQRTGFNGITTPH